MGALKIIYWACKMVIKYRKNYEHGYLCSADYQDIGIWLQFVITSGNQTASATTE